MRCRCLPLLLILALLTGTSPGALAKESDSQLNFKIYSPDSHHAPSVPQGGEPSLPDEETTPSTEMQLDTSALQEEHAREDTPVASETPVPTEAQPSTRAGVSGMDPIEGLIDPDKVGDSSNTSTEKQQGKTAETQSDKVAETQSADRTGENASTSDSASTVDSAPAKNKVLQGYIRVVPTGTKIPIIMDTAIDSDTSQEGDEFSARTAEDLTIDGNTAVPAGSIIKGRIARLNSPRALNRSGSVALKFDTVTTPDNRQIPLVATLVARGGVVHAKRGLKDVAIDCGTFSLPTAAGLGIGLLAGSGASSSSSFSAAGAAALGAGIGAAVGLAILLSKKGKRVDVRPGDELKIELAEDLRMPMM